MSAYVVVDNAVYNYHNPNRRHRRRDLSPASDRNPTDTYQSQARPSRLPPRIVQPNPPQRVAADLRVPRYYTLGLEPADTMCTTRLYTERYPDGHREKSYRFERCNEARLGLPCVESASSSRSRTTGTQPTYAYADTYLPPTPSYTPVISSPVYRSGDDSDRSYHSSSSTGRRRSGRYYVSDNQYLDVNPRSYRASQRDSALRGAERVVIVDGPPTPRTPPQTFNFPHSAPSSPNFGHAVPHVEASPRVRDSTRRRPIIVDERPRPRVQIVEPSPERSSKTHSRTGSADKTSSAFTTTTTSSLREQEKLERQRAEIARQNAEINSRPTIPVSRPLKRSTTSYTRPSAAFDQTEVTDPFARIDLNRDQRREERARRLEEKAEQEAMDRRLRERLMPRRRATVGSGTRRHPVLYDDGLYRWE